jgi:hypothetical protein
MIVLLPKEQCASELLVQAPSLAHRIENEFRVYVFAWLVFIWKVAPGNSEVSA